MAPSIPGRRLKNDSPQNIRLRLNTLKNEDACSRLVYSRVLRSMMSDPKT
jgi:hypothetical protein